MTRTLYAHGRVATPVDPGATALLVADGRVAWVGRDADAPPSDHCIDLAGDWLAPAFVDAHVHATATGLALTELDLTGAPSLAVALDRVADAARRLRGAAVLGTGWDDSDWPEGRPPTARELDRASYGGVVYLARVDVHSAVVSSALLAAVPAARAATGFGPDGMMREQAHHLVREAALAAITPAHRRAAQQAMLDRAAALGIVCVHECGGPDIAGEDDFRSVLTLDHRVRRIGYWGELGALDRARDLGAWGPGGDLFLDGSLGSGTAHLCTAYADAPTVGAGFVDTAALTDHLVACAEAGVQTGFHAIGDAALGQLLFTALPAAAERVGEQALRAGRHRVEHAELLDRDLIAALARFGLVASVQPGFDARWGGPDGMYVRRLGRERAAAMNPFRALTDAGVPLALGSDSPVTPLDPWGTVRAAVQHRTAGHGLSAREAFDAHTRGGWAAAGLDGRGALVPGAPADLAVWETGPLVDGLPCLEGPDPTCRLLCAAGDE